MRKIVSVTFLCSILLNGMEESVVLHHKKDPVRHNLQQVQTDAQFPLFIKDPLLKALFDELMPMISDKIKNNPKLKDHLEVRRICSDFITGLGKAFQCGDDYVA